VSEDRQIFTLKQVVSSIRKTLEDRYQQAYWVKAEMHKLNLYPSGHAFPELVQKEAGKIVAQITGSIWKQQLHRINHQFMTVVKEPLKEGTTLLLQVRISFHETFGLSLQITDIDPNYALGELQREREETLKKLHQEGVLNKNQALAFPLLPQRIAIISADTSKGLSDFMKVLNNNAWNYAFYTHLFPAYLQGDVAVSSIIQQLNNIEKVKDHFDVIVIVRGGGGEVGLSCYNNYELCKAITNSSLPILTGIGHSTNMTVAELVAFRNAITPTELADFLLQAFHEFSVPVQEAKKLLFTYSKNLLDATKHAFKTEIKHFKNSATIFLNHEKNKVSTAQIALKNNYNNTFNLQQEHFIYLQKTLQNVSLRNLKLNREKISDLAASLPKKITRITEQAAQRIQVVEKHVSILDPKNILKRGYSITRFEGNVISNKEALKNGMNIETELFDFNINSTIENFE
jgi:exodeoxyribonuclease VII large subunit